MSPMLPPELYQIIIDHLHNDKRTLSQCTFVCQRWLPIARYHLIPSIQIAPHNYRDLRELLASEHSSLATSVSALSLNEWDLTDANTAAFLHDIINRFPSVKKLEFSSVAFDTGRPLAEALFSRITRLDLFFCLFPSSTEFINFVSLFPSIDTLSCSVCKILDALDINIPIFEPPRSLKNVSLDEQSLLTLTPDGPQQSSFRPERLDIVDISFGNDAVADLLNGAGTALRHLRIEYNHTIQSSASLSSTYVGFDLSHNTALKSLCIRFPRRLPLFGDMQAEANFNNIPQEPEPISHIVPLLSSISSTSLTDLRLMVYIVSPDTLFYIDWEGIDQLLVDNDRFAQVKLVVELYPSHFEHTTLYPSHFGNIATNALREEQGMLLEPIIYSSLEGIARQGRLDVRYPILRYMAAANQSLRMLLDMRFGR